MENRNNLLIELSLKHMTYTEKNKRINFARVFKDYQLIYNDIDNQQDLVKEIYSLHTKEEYENMKYSERQASEKELVHNSTRYKEINTDEKLSPDEVLELHGLDSVLNELISAGSTRSKIGTKGNDEGYFINTYNNIRYKPREFKITEEFITQLFSDITVPKITIEKSINSANDRLLEIPLFDMHFGNMSYEDYIIHQQQIADKILNKEWNQILFIIGQDLFHNDDFRGRTTSGTLIEKENMEIAFDDCIKFYFPLIELALENALNVDVIYSRGNHDETLGWAFVKMLSKVYPQLNVDSKQAEHKFYIYHNVFLGYTHGDKIRDNKVVKNFEALYRLKMAKANRRVIKKGHVHTLKSFDDNGTHVMTLGTANESDDWHIENGFIGNHKSFEVFEYNKNTLKEHSFIELD